MQKIEFHMKVPVVTSQEDDLFVSCCPTLDVCSQGNTKQEAIINLVEAMQVFLESCYNRGVLDDVLKQCGYNTIVPHQENNRDNNEVIDVPVDLIINQNNAQAHAC